jgi:NAD(P)-dependent dehydrogenase (short-subunit alcohol dehydrogenase family)
MELGITGKVAIVSGASKGIARAIAEELAAEGVHLALGARSKKELATVAAELAHRWKVQVLPVEADLSTLGGVQTFVRETMAHFGRVDILINVAGAIRPGSLLTKPDADWHEDWALKVFGYVRMMREVFPILQSNGGGRIVNIIGSAGRQPDPSYLAGGGANAALMNITKAVAMEGGPHNILVNAINPGPTRTDRWDSINARLATEWGKSIPEVEGIRIQDNPLQRPAESSEVAALAVFLVSARASYINGVVVEMDGGTTRCI